MARWGWPQPLRDADMGAGSPTCGAGALSCSGCGAITVPADSKLARLATARAAGNMATLDGARSEGEDTRATSASARLATGNRREFVAPAPPDGVLDGSAPPGNGAVRLGAGGVPVPLSIEEIKRRVQDRLFDACREGSFKKTVDAITAGADIQGTTLRGQTPLMLAAASANKQVLDTIRFLLDALADPEAKDNEGWTALLHACRNSGTEVAILLLDRSASVKARANDGKSAPMLASMDGGDQLTMELINRSAMVDKKDDRGWSVLFYASEGKRHELVKWLIKKNASVNEKAKDGLTPLMVAAQVGGTKIGEKLIKKGASINAVNSQGWTALMLSLKAHQEEFADMMVDEGADIAPRNNMDEDSIDIAESMGLNGLRGKMEMKLRLLHDEV